MLLLLSACLSNLDAAATTQLRTTGKKKQRCAAVNTARCAVAARWRRQMQAAMFSEEAAKGLLADELLLELAGSPQVRPCGHAAIAACASAAIMACANAAIAACANAAICGNY